MSNFMDTQVTILNTKIAAVRELNSTRGEIDDLVLRENNNSKTLRMKTLIKLLQMHTMHYFNAPRYGLPTVGRALLTQLLIQVKRRTKTT